MYQFVYWLKALAAILITNAHYEDIYPISAIANGGLLGDVIFFAVSGYCANVCGRRFWGWYKNRLVRVYTPVWIITAVFLLIGVYYVGDFGRFLYAFFYPTYYHFVGSILVLYIPFYFVSRWIQSDQTLAGKRLTGVMVLVAAAYFVVFYTVYDRSYCHIDATSEPMIRFLFFESLLVGLYFRINARRFTVPAKKSAWGVAVVLLAVYLVVKVFCSRGTIPAGFQWLSQVSLLMLLAVLFRCVMGLESFFREKEATVGKAVRFVAAMTLEIYVVQYAPILYLNIGAFPVNFVIVTAAIVVMAWLLHKVCGLLIETGKRIGK